MTFSHRFVGRTLRCALVVAAFVTSGIAPAGAGSLPQPEGRIVLSITGAIDSTNADSRADFDMAMLQAMPAHTIRTSTPWTDGVTEFTGVKAQVVLDKVGARGEYVDAVALNDYQFEIPVTDVERYPVLLAYRMNGERLRIRDKGPLWVVYPLDAHPELRNEETHSKMVWQLRRLVVK